MTISSRTEAAGDPVSLNRRRLLAGASAALICGGASPAEAAPTEAYRDFAGALPAEPEADEPSVAGRGHFGGRRHRVGAALHPYASEGSVGDRIVAHAPTTTPLDVMLYFEALKTLNREKEAYNAGWKRRWNPVIVGFFRETATTPSGDTTAWCAASLNWTLARCGYAGGTGSASSGSFREVRGRTRHPRPGDIVVFGATDPAAFARGQGHVGLFLAETSDRVLVLGGNQKNAYGHQAVCRKWLAKRDDERHLQSYHAVRALRSAT